MEVGRSAGSSGVSSSSSSQSDWVRLNVGGTLFQTTRSTLSKDEGSFLFKLCAHHSNSNGLHSKSQTASPDTLTSPQQEDSNLGKDSSGAWLIDRDPRYFSVVLNFLRHGRLIIDKDLRIEGVLAEAEFYQLSALIKIIQEQQLADQNPPPPPPPLLRTVYRVLQCHEDELTQMISTLSDGWKFEQLVSIGSGYNPENSEFLAVVSREIPAIVGSRKDEEEKGITEKGRVLVSRGSRM